jgi:hypothetical protein
VAEGMTVKREIVTMEAPAAKTALQHFICSSVYSVSSFFVCIQSKTGPLAQSRALTVFEQ